MESIFGIDQKRITVITEDGAPSGSKDFVMWCPAFHQETHSSVLTDAAHLMAFLMKRGIRVIMFCKVGQQSLHLQCISKHVLVSQNV